MTAIETNDIQVFSNSEFGQVTTIIINTIPWFVGKEIAEILGYQKARNAILQHIDKEDKQIFKKSQIRNLEQKPQNKALEIPNRGLTIINESGLYSLILSSKLSSAKKFKQWVTSEVLPSIRKYGAYMTHETLEKAIYNPDFLIKLAENLKFEQEKNKYLELTNKALTEQAQEWTDKSILNALVRAYAVNCCKGNFAAAWSVLYRQLKYKYGIDIKIRSGKANHSKLLIDLLHDDEIKKAIKLAVIICERCGINAGKVINEVNYSKIFG